MLNKKRLIVFGVFLLALFFMTMYAGGTAQNTSIATRLVKFIDGYNNAEISTQNVEVGKEAIVPDSPTHRNLLFIGWYNDETEITSFKNITENLTVISRYVDDINNNGIADSEEESYTVTFFDTIANENIRVVNVLTGMDATAPAVPSYDGYTFTGWSTSYRNVNQNITINTLYELNEELAEITTHTVTFLVDGEEISTQEIVNGATASEPSETVIPKKEKQVFIGWDKSFDNVTSDLTINAIYADDINGNDKADNDEEKFTIRFETNGNGTFTGETSFTGLLEGLKVSDFIELPEYEANPGYTFIGWDRELPEDDAVITDSIVYTAIFKDITEPEVIVSDIVDGQFNPEKFSFNAKDPNGIASLSYTIRPKGKEDSVQSGYIKYQDILDDITKTYSINELPDGEYELRISIRDTAENPNHGSVINFIVDNTNPTLEDVVINKNITNENSIEISGKIFDENIRYTSIRIFNSLNESVLQKTVFGNNDELIENLDISTFDDDTYRVRLKVYDLAGNTEQINKTLVIDRTAPQLTIEALNYNHSIDNNYYNNESIEIKVTATDNYEGDLLYQYGNDNKWVESNTYIKEWTAEKFIVKVKDTAGNISEATIGLHIDRTPMTIDFKTINNELYNGAYTNSLKPIYIKPNNGWKLLDSGYLWSTNSEGITKEEIVNPFWHNDSIENPISDGEYYLWAYALDYNGNYNLVRSNAYIIDQTSPELNISIDDVNPTTFSFTTTDEHGLKSMSYTIWTKGKKVLKQSGGNTFKGTKEKAETYIIKELPDGEYELRVSVKDLADNYNHLLPIYFEIDKTSPIASIVSPAKDGINFGKKVIITGEVDPSEVNMKRHWFEITTPTGGTYYEGPIDNESLTHSFDLDTSYGIGEYKIRYVATDKAGNRSDAPNFSNSTIRTLNVVDINDPETTIEVTPISNGNNFTVKGIAKDDQKLNRVYVQLVNRTTGDRCGGTTIHLLTSLN
ncbi:MAG: InlB B-repeat-containing protein, partial [Bacilli bacterium]|nr:InlB B-repeat-containing protein [Bacilli bacterium]